MKEKICKGCGTSFIPKYRSVIYCSYECSKNHRIKMFSCDIHGKVNNEDLYIDEKDRSSAFITCKKCRAKKQKIRSRLRKNKTYTCINCNVSFSSLTVGFRKYCDSKCAIEYLKNTFVCKVHGKINPDRMKETFTNKGHCIRCRDCDINEIKKSRNKKKKPIICKICKVAFSNISSGSPVVCSEECRIEYKKITGRKFFLKYKEELPDHYVNRLSRGEKLPPDFLEIAKLNIRLKRKIKEIKENEKC